MPRRDRSPEAVAREWWAARAVGLGGINEDGIAYTAAVIRAERARVRRIVRQVVGKRSPTIMNALLAALREGNR